MNNTFCNLIKINLALMILLCFLLQHVVILSQIKIEIFMNLQNYLKKMM